ncbi:ferredoxin [Streptomyces sp. NPDC047081]|uniref:ferredoxin n=1 Tax=Streptomyces sp. NPDC047081 TaxID=3154706 RepID=UPI0034022E14
MTTIARIDRTLCLGMGLCEAMADDLFVLDDDGIAVAQEDRDQDRRRDRLRDIAACCPTGAITVTEEDISAAVPEDER